jgi:toxin HigB-1
VQIEYGDETLRRLAEDPDFAPRQWSRDVVRAYRKKIQLLGAAKDERDLRQLRGLRLKELSGNRAGTSSIRLNDQYRLVLRFRKDPEGRVVIVLELVDYH